MGALLIAGPLALDDHPQQAGLLGGVGGYAAIAAAPLAPTQLWCRGGSDISNQVKAILTQRHIDLSGVDWIGPTPRGTAAGFEPGGALLPVIEPTSADSLDGVLFIGLPPDETRRALKVIGRLKGADTRPLIVSPRPADLADLAFRRELLAATEILVLSVAKAIALTGTTDPLAAAQALQEDGAKVVVLTAGQLGGLICYRQKSTTYPALPVPSIDKAGVSAAFPGALAAWIAGSGKSDFSTVKRGCAVASAVGGICAQGIGPKKLLTADRGQYLERFNRLRRDQKY
jgi:sugar/nucleoside kinase (ribokinase family)